MTWNHKKKFLITAFCYSHILCFTNDCIKYTTLLQLPNSGYSIQLSVSTLHACMFNLQIMGCRGVEDSFIIQSLLNLQTYRMWHTNVACTRWISCCNEEDCFICKNFLRLWVNYEASKNSNTIWKFAEPMKHHIFALTMMLLWSSHTVESSGIQWLESI